MLKKEGTQTIGEYRLIPYYHSKLATNPNAFADHEKLDLKQIQETRIGFNNTIDHLYRLMDAYNEAIRRSDRTAEADRQ